MVCKWNSLWLSNTGQVQMMSPQGWQGSSAICHLILQTCSLIYFLTRENTLQQSFYLLIFLKNWNWSRCHNHPYCWELSGNTCENPGICGFVIGKRHLFPPELASLCCSRGPASAKPWSSGLGRRQISEQRSSGCWGTWSESWKVDGWRFIVQTGGAGRQNFESLTVYGKILEK